MNEAERFPRRFYAVVEITASYEFGEVGVVRRRPFCAGEMDVIDNLRRFPLDKLPPPPRYGTPERKRSKKR